MSLTTCSRHPGEPAKALCGRCGDFLCARCKAESPAPGLCPECAARAAAAPPPAASAPTFALIAAVLCALLSGGFLLATSGLYVFLAKTGPNLIVGWNSIMGVIYFGIAYGLAVRAPWGYGWSLGTQRLNALFGGFYLAQHLSKPGTASIIVVFSAVSLAFHLGGWVATWLARPHFLRRRS